MKVSKFKIKRSADKQFYGELVSTNGKVLHTTETMHSKANVKNNFESTKKSMLSAVIIDDTTE